MKCPHCLDSFYPDIKRGSLTKAKSESKEVDVVIWYYEFCTCPACGKLIMWLISCFENGGGVKARMVHPKAVSRIPIPQEVPDVFAKDYREACIILNDSANASAALSRRCLQNLLREKAGAKNSDLANEIQQVIDSKQLPSQLSEAIDSIRAIGNFAAHPIKSTNTGAIVDVEPGEAEWLLDTLEGLFDFYFVQPAILQKKREALNKKLEEAGKPELK
jgi:hypothetical protein